MAKILFDVLVPEPQRERVAEVFTTALGKLVDSQQLTSATVTTDHNPDVPADVEEQLRQNYRDEHEDRELEDSSVCRYDITVDGVTGSLNQLAMVLSRLLTPHAVLPKDHVLLEDERAHERPAIFPWTVNITR